MALTDDEADDDVVNRGDKGDEGDEGDQPKRRNSTSSRSTARSTGSGYTSTQAAVSII